MRAVFDGLCERPLGNAPLSLWWNACHLRRCRKTALDLFRGCLSHSLLKERFVAGTAGRIMKQKTPKAIEVTSERMEELLQRASDSLCDEDSELMRQIFESYAELYRIVGDRNTTIARLRKMMFGPTSEKAGNVLDEGQDASEDPEPPSSDDASDDTSSKHRTGHGRHSADDYPGAEQVHIEHPELSAGDACPDCSQGKLYEKRPGVLVRFVGQAPVQATVYRRQKLRCHLCGKVFTAPVPEGIGDSKYDHTVASMIGSR